MTGEPALPPLNAELLRRATRKPGLHKGHVGLSARWFELVADELLGLYTAFLLAVGRARSLTGSVEALLAPLDPNKRRWPSPDRPD